MNAPKVSIICTFYNAEKYIEESILSILKQSFTDFEFILVDDGSTDNSLKIVKKLSHPKIRILVNKNNEGYNVGRNRALLSANGEYIAIHDADDISLFHRIEKQVMFLEKNPNITVVGSWAAKINDNGQTIGAMVYPAQDSLAAINSIIKFRLNPIIDPSAMYRRQEILDFGGYSMEDKITADFDLWCRLIQNGKKIASIPEILIKYRINPTGLSKSRKEEIDKNTDLIIASFRAKNCKIPILRPSYFNNECFTEIKGD